MELVIEMKKQILVHSFYGKDCTQATFFINIATFILSCLYAKKSGYEIHLHTDSKSKEFLQWAPYDIIYTDLENCQSPASGLYAWPKFVSMENEPLKAVHIDGDVFIKQYIDFNFDNYDIIVQDEERPTWEWLSRKQSKDSVAQCEFPSWSNKESLAMYNCGIVGIANQEFKDEYIKTYWNLAEQFKDKGLSIPHSIPDIIFEQKILLDLAKHRNQKVKELIRFEYRHEDATKLHYQHLIGCWKFRCIEQTLKMIHVLDKNIYYKLKHNFYGIFKSIWFE